MGIVKLTKTGFKSSTYEKYDSFLAGNTAFSPNSYESIATTTVGSGGVADITFSSIPSTYEHLQIRIIAKNTVADYETKMQVGNGSVDTGSNYADHYVLGNGASTFANATTSATGAIIGIEGNTANNYSAYICDILDYKNTNKYKTFRTLNGVDKNGSGSVRLQSGLWQSTSAINIIKLSHSVGNFEQYTQAALYGIKGV